MAARLLACLLAQALGMGVLHLRLMGGERPRPAWFCAASGVLAAILGVLALLESLLAHARESAWTIAWGPAFALGFFASGAAAGAAWLALVMGGAWWLRRRLSR